jgi:hypothetical protein
MSLAGEPAAVITFSLNAGQDIRRALMSVLIAGLLWLLAFSASAAAPHSLWRLDPAAGLSFNKTLRPGVHLIEFEARDLADWPLGGLGELVLLGGRVYRIRADRVEEHSSGRVANPFTFNLTNAPSQASTLTVVVNGGGGVVTGGGINCPGAYTTTPPSGSMVSLTASAGTGAEFTGWLGEGCSGVAVCAVKVDAAKTISASSAPKPVSV